LICPRIAAKNEANPGTLGTICHFAKATAVKAEQVTPKITIEELPRPSTGRAGGKFWGILWHNSCSHREISRGLLEDKRFYFLIKANLIKLYKTMQEHEAFDQTLKKFDIRGAELARETGVSGRQISQFRHGKIDLSSSTLFKLLRALPPEAREHFAAGTLEISGISVESLSDHQKATLLNEIADSIRKKHKSSNLQRDLATI
jgi:transcriptional regulator with XRE-family HTH domain